MAEPKDVAGLRAVERLSFERIAIRTRKSGVTQSAWRLEAQAREGRGEIVIVEVSPGETFYRGDGMFLGWPQERMSEIVAALRPQGEPEREHVQLG